jgi:hypothetical protein
MVLRTIFFHRKKVPVEVIQHVEEWVDVPVEQIQYEDVKVDKYRSRKKLLSSKFSIDNCQYVFE